MRTEDTIINELHLQTNGDTEHYCIECCDQILSVHPDKQNNWHVHYRGRPIGPSARRARCM